jgi:hypothetical protein
LSQLDQFIFDTGSNGIGELVQLLLSGRQDENGIIRLFASLLRWKASSRRVIPTNGRAFGTEMAGQFILADPFLKKKIH